MLTSIFTSLMPLILITNCIFLLQIIGDNHVQLLSLDWKAAWKSEQGSIQVQTTYLLALNLSEPNVIKALQHPN